MNCTEVAAILDAHRSARLTAAERAVVDEHLLDCGDCAAGWQAHTELLGLRLPPIPATLLERALGAARVPQAAQPRRARAPIVIAGTLLAGAALASLTIVSLTRSSPVETATATRGEPSTMSSEAITDAGALTDHATREATERTTSVELVETALSIAPLVRRPPDYPPDAQRDGLEGHVVVRFDVTAAGIVENLSVVESSDALFEDSAVRSVAEWRYLPRIAAGKRAPSEGIQTVIRFALDGGAPPPDARRQQSLEAAIRDDTEFSNGLEAALNRLAADNLRGAELQLDELRAVYAADKFQADLFGFYGYLFTVQGNYDRAIDAYETSLAAHARSGRPTAGPWAPLANLYFARHQYDMALKTLLRPNLAGGNRRVSPEADALIQKLNALGVTEETLQ